MTESNCDINKSASSSLSLGTLHFQEANEKVRACLETSNTVDIHDVYAQRYLGCAMPKDKHLNIYGTPGNDMAAYMDGGSIEVFGNAQDQIGNTMNAGTIVIHGRCGDAAGYAMRGGSIFIRDNCGWRVGINMKQYDDRCPTIVIGGDAGDFLAEYMAGGIIVLLGSHGAHLASGMHGGVIYLKNAPKSEDISEDLLLASLDKDDETLLNNLLQKYDSYFAKEIGSKASSNLEGFCKLIPKSSRPYASMYVN